MRHHRALVLWVCLGLAGVVLLIWGYPRAFPFAPRHWEVTREEAVDIALARLRDLGEPVKGAYVTVLLAPDNALERRLQLALRHHDAEWLWKTGLPAQVQEWDVFVYAPDAAPYDWTYSAGVALSGEINYLLLRLDLQAPGAPLAAAEARRRADAFLAAQGFDLSRYGEPRLRTYQLTARNDLVLQYPDRLYQPWKGVSQGVSVVFRGDRLAGFTPWVEDPRQRQLQQTLRPIQLTFIVFLLEVIVLSVILAFPFLRRYHAGEVGVRRAGQIFLLVAGCGALFTLLAARSLSEGLNFGVSRAQTTWVWMVATLLFSIFPIALVSFFAWTVGESICRQHWGRKLAAFDALFQKEWGNATVARASLIGWMAGLLLAGGAMTILVALSRWNIWAFASHTWSLQTRLPGLEVLTDAITTVLSPFLLVMLCVLPSGARRLRVLGGGVAAVLVLLAVLQPPLLALPVTRGIPVLLWIAVVPVVLFLAYDLLTVLTAGVVFLGVLSAFPLLAAADASLQVQGWLALGVAAAPLLASLRSLGSDKEFVYRYEDIPPHVRRIAERERQRVELETARRIQSSILPELPPRLAGVDISHAYLPASEVGGDFYDVLALEDGRLAVAVGDVAGHGVSSGLVMSMAKSALAVQVTFDPEVGAVFRTLNRTVYQTARKRLLATLCYALLDPQRRELLYASAGHLYPYRITAGGKVEALESTAYPLGVRGELQVEPRTARLEPGDTLFLFSDGLVEARAEGSEEMFGFERLEQSLSRHARQGVDALRDGVLADITRFTAHAPREDDQTILVLRLP